MEIVAVREADEGGFAYLVVYEGEGYLVETGTAVRVNVERALSYDSWDVPVPALSFALIPELLEAITRLRAKEGR